MQELQASLYQSEYKGMTSYVAESELLRVELVPELGGKLVSLLNKQTEKEWLLGSGDRPLRAPVYGSTFIDSDMSGWDECFPTIESCLIDVADAGGIMLPDHGDIWSLPWEASISGGVITASVQGRQLPFHFSRGLELTSSRSFALCYEVHHTGQTPFSFLWAAHPQFSVDEPTQILIPEEIKTLRCVFGGQHHEVDATYDVVRPWIIDPVCSGDGMKFYNPGRGNEAWSGLYGVCTGNYLYVKADNKTVPYWGVWIDQGICNDRTTVALEPGIGYYDSLTRAVENGTAITLNPGECYRWRLNIEIGQESKEAFNKT